MLVVLTVGSTVMEVFDLQNRRKDTKIKHE